MHILIAVLMLILAIFGVASMMDSYATVKQAQATIEVAQVAQVNAWGNLVVILLLALVIVCVLAVIVWMVYSRQRSAFSGQRRLANSRGTAIEHTPLDEITTAKPVDLNTLIQLKTLEVLARMSPHSTSPPTPLLKERGEVEDELAWLR